jgi:hypothetical protein
MILDKRGFIGVYDIDKRGFIGVYDIDKRGLIGVYDIDKGGSPAYLTFIFGSSSPASRNRAIRSVPERVNGKG